MAKASLSIEIGGKYNGKAISKAEAALRKLQVEAAKSSTGIESSFVNTGEKLMETGSKISSVGNRITDTGSAISKKLTVPIAAAGVAAFKTASDYEQATSRIQSALGATQEEAQRFSDIGKSIYENGWGESLNDVNNAIIQTKSTIRDIDDEGLKTVTQNALVLGSTLDADVNETIRGTNALMTGFGLSAQEASDLMAAGMQRGLNYTDELGDNLSEYSVRWGEAGMSASQYFSLLEAGTANGAYNLDKVGDFLNEFLTSLTDGRMKEGIGQFSKGTQDVFHQFETGKATAEDVLNAVIRDMKGMTDETKRATIASETWSSLGEDNAMGMLLSLGDVKDSYGDVAGAAEQAGESASNNFAAKANSAMRKLMGSIEPLGEPLLRIATGIADATEQAAEWFAGLDEGSQNAIVCVAGVAAALGPVLMVGGKIITTVGNTITSVGKASQTVGVFIGKMKGTVPATQEAMKASLADAEAKKQEAAAAEKSANASTKSATAAKEDAAASTSAAAADKQQAAAATQASAANTKNASAMQKVGQVAKAAGKLVGGFVASFAFSKALEVVSDLAEKQSQLRDATEGLTGAASNMNTSYSIARNTMADISGVAQTTAQSMGSVRAEIDNMIEKNAELAGTLQGIFSEAGTSIGMMENYRDVIAGMGDGTGLTAEQASRLQVALDGVNKQCGTSYEVSGNAEQGYRIMANGAEVAKDEILKLIDAQKTQIRLEATKEAYGEAYKTLAENEKTATEATAEFNRLLEEQKYWSNEAANGNREAGGQLEAIGLQLVDAKNNMDRANSAYKAQKDTCDALEDSQVAYQMALDAGNGSIADAVTNNGLLVSAMQNANKDTTSLIGSLSELGISTTTISGLTANESVKIAQAYNGTKESVTNALFELATNSSTLGQQAGQWLTDGFSANAQGAVNAATNVTGLTTAQFKLICDSAGATGEDAIVALANGISTNASKSTGAARIVKQALVLELTKGDVTAAAQILGEDIDQGLVDGITGSSSMPSEAVGLMSQNTIDAAKTAFESHSPSQVMLRLGNDIDQGLADGITGNEAAATTAMSGVGNSTINAVSGLPVSAQTIGSSTGSFFSTAIGWAKSAAYSNASGLSSNAKSGIAGTPGAFSATGSSAANNFSGAIGRGDASASGRALANTGDRGLRSVKTSGAGQNFVQGFANGFGKVNIFDAAWKIGTRALDAIKGALGIKSPSREAMAVGDYFGQGLVIGMAGTENSVSAMSERLASAMEVDPQTTGMSVEAAYRSHSTRDSASRQESNETTIVNNYYFGDILFTAKDLKGINEFADFIEMITQAKRAYA